MRLGDENIAAKRARVEAATEGPWAEDPEGIGYVINGDPTDWKKKVITSGGSLDDLVFIAHARTDIPELLAEREELVQHLHDAIAAAEAEAISVDDLNERNAELLKEVRDYYRRFGSLY